MRPEYCSAGQATNLAIYGNLVALTHQLDHAHNLAAEAREAMDPRMQNRNLAIGTMIPLQQILPECDALVRAVLTLHTWKNRLPAPTEGGAA